MEKSNISPKSNKLFTLSSIKQATRALMGKGPKDGFNVQEQQLAEEFWAVVNEQMKDWQLVQQKEISPAQLRQEYLHAHGVGLHAIGLMGHALLCEHPQNWQKQLSNLKSIDWQKTNPEWVKRAMLHGKLSKSNTCIQLTCNALKQHLSLPLTPEEKALEKQVNK